MNELLGDFVISRADMLHILRELSPGKVGSHLQTGLSLDGVDIEVGTNTIQHLPGPVRRILLFCAARLPLLEKNMGLAHDCYKSFRHCIGGMLCMEVTSVP